MTELPVAASSPDELGAMALQPGPYIRRRDDCRGRAWLVRVGRKDVKLERMFSDGTFGGIAQALAAAQQWRDAQPWYRSGRFGIAIRRGPDDPDAAYARALRRVFAHVPANPGHQDTPRPAPRLPKAPPTPQVARHDSLLVIDGRVRLCAFWSATWTDRQGKTWTRKFSVNFWGEEAAHQKALDIYRHQQRQA